MSGPPAITIEPIIVEPTLLDNPAKITSPTAAVTVDAAPRPDYLVPILTGYGTKITRIGGDAGATTPIGGLWSKAVIHRYSKVPFWNDDMTLMGPIYNKGDALRSGPPANSPTKMILDGESYLPIIGDKFSTNNNAFLSSSAEFRWRPGYPTQAISWVEGTKTLMVWDVVNQKLIWSYSFKAILTSRAPTLGKDSFGFLSEGVPSNDGRFVALCSRWPAPQTSGQVDFFFVVDLLNWRVGPINNVPMRIVTANNGNIDWCSISPMGDYVIIKYGSTKVPSVARCFDVNPTTLACTPRVFSAGDNPLRSVTPVAPDLEGWMMNHSHGDMAISTDAAFTGAPGSGEEVLVGGIRDTTTANHCSNAEKAAQGKIVAQSLRTGKHLHVSMGTAQLSAATECEDQHTSARCHKEPNHLLHTYAYHATNKFADEMVIWPVLLHGGAGGPIRCGTTRTDDQDSVAPTIGMDAKYFGEAHACPSPGLEKIVFVSNWQKNANPAGPHGDYKSYILEPISTAEVQESDYTIEVQTEPVAVKTTAGDDEPHPDKLRYFSKG